MSLNNTQIRYYDYNVLRLPLDKRTEYNAQVDRLIANVRQQLHKHTEFRITRVKKAGSFAKHTILRKLASDDHLDCDVAFYLRDHDASNEDLASLNNSIRGFLDAAYPNKSVEDFQIDNRTANVRFVGSGLLVDIVPVIEMEAGSEYGWQYGLDGTRVLTCVKGQLEFVKARKDSDGDFRTLVRLAKRWRNYNGVTSLKSYQIELIMAYLLDTDGKEMPVEERFRRFLLYIVQSGLKDKIVFDETPKPIGSFTEPVVIVDPVNGQNNVAARMTEDKRQNIVALAKESWEAAHYASVENDPEVWKEVFGPKFRTADE